MRIRYIDTNTRQYPRTLQEAFGPHTSRKIQEPKETGYSTAWWLVFSACCLVAMVVVGVTS